MRVIMITMVVTAMRMRPTLHREKSELAYGMKQFAETIFAQNGPLNISMMTKTTGAIKAIRPDAEKGSHLAALFCCCRQCQLREITELVARAGWIRHFVK